MTDTMTPQERALWVQASDDYAHALAIAKKAWLTADWADVEPNVVQAATATVLIHITKLRESSHRTAAPSSTARAAVNPKLPASGAPVAVPPCPQCGGEMWDNRGRKKNPKAPDFVCKDKQGCKDDKGYTTGLWERDLKAGNGRPNAMAGKNAQPESYQDRPDALAEDGGDDLPF